MNPSALETGNILEALEARIAPASISLNGGTLKATPDDSFIRDFFEDGDELSPANFGAPEIVSASELRFKDADGDGITIKFDRDVLTLESLASAFHFEEAEHGSQLVGIDIAKLAGDAKSLRGLDISVTSTAAGVVLNFEPAQVYINGEFVTVESYGGNGRAEIGFIKAAGIDLGDVSVEGNLGKIIAGDSKLGTAGLESLTVESFGALGGAGLSDATALTSTITGSLKKLNVAHDINGALLYIYGGKKGSLGEAHIGGDMIGGDFSASGSIYADGKIGSVVVEGDLVGGSAVRSGLIFAAVGIKSASVGGDVTGGGSRFSGAIMTEGTLGHLDITGDLVGGTAERSGFVQAGGGVKDLAIEGGILGGTAYGAGRVEAKGLGSVVVEGGLHAGSDEYAGSIYSTKSIKSLDIGGLEGGNQTGSGAVFAGKSIGKVVVAGDVEGGQGTRSGYIEALKSIGQLSIDGDLSGSTGTYSGSIASFNGKIGKISHDGASVAGSGTDSGEILNFINKDVKRSHSHGSSGTGAVITIGHGSQSPVTVIQPGTMNFSAGVDFAQTLAGVMDGLAAGWYTPAGGVINVIIHSADGVLSLDDLVTDYGFTWPDGLSVVDKKDGEGIVISKKPASAGA